MKKLLFILASLFILSLCMAGCDKEEEGMPEQKPDDSLAMDSLRNILAGKWTSVSPAGSIDVYVFSGDTIRQTNVCSELTDTILYQIVSKDSLQIIQQGQTERKKVMVYSTDSIKIADLVLKRLLQGEEPECNMILPSCNRGSEPFVDYWCGPADYECIATIGGNTSDPRIVFAQFPWDMEPMAYLLSTGSFIFGGIYRICNYPEYAKAWKIPEEGLPVVFTGKLYSPSYNPGAHPAIRSYGDLELVTIKKLREELYPKEIPFTEFSLEETSCQWNNFEPNNVFVINSNDELKDYIICSNEEYPQIEFSRYTLLLTKGFAGRGLDNVSNRLTQIATNEYKLEIDVTLYMITIPSSWRTAILIPKASQDIHVLLSVN